MTPEVSQWLAEIRVLRQQLHEIRKERDGAYANASKWRSLYEAEARQRRQVSQQPQPGAPELQTSVQAVSSEDASNGKVEHDSAAVSRKRLSEIKSVSENSSPLADLEGFSPDELRQHLRKALAECDRLTKQLDAERVEHAKTQQQLSLTNAIPRLPAEKPAHRPPRLSRQQNQAV